MENLQLQLESEERHDKTINTNNCIYRYNFTQEFMEELYKFSKIHQYDDRKSFKEYWDIWVIQQDEIISNECNRLNILKYNGNILDKMYKSARYYFRKKSTSITIPIERKNYSSVNKCILDLMDTHILSEKNNVDYKPSTGFISFCSKNTEELKLEIGRLMEHKMNSTEIKHKIKKTYKNRYFIMKTK